MPTLISALFLADFQHNRRFKKLFSRFILFAVTNKKTNFMP